MRLYNTPALLAAFALSVVARHLSAADPPARPAAKALTVSDIFDFELATDPQISPDGKRVIYVRHFNDIVSDRRCSNLWIVNCDGEDHRPLTTGNTNDTLPRWSPDGTQIAYISSRDGSAQIYRRWMDTGQTAKLSNLTTAPSGIAWSPDGKWISFTAHVPDVPKPIIKMPTPPDGAKWAEPAKVIDKLIYRFNAVGYIKPGYTQLFVLPADGGTPRQISSGQFQHSEAAFGASEAVWTPDGKSLIISANRHQNYESEPLDTEIYEFSLDSGDVKALTDRRGPDGAPQISPDGRQIAYVGFDDKYLSYQVRRLYVMNRDGTGSRAISGDFDRDIAHPVWAPDGKGVYFFSDDQGNTGLYFTTLHGQTKLLAKNVGSGTSAGGRGSTLTISRNGTIAFTQCRPDLPGDVVVGGFNSGETKTLTGVNDDLLANRTLGQVETIWYKSSKDDRKIQGWIIRPPLFDPAKKYPLILEIHGGPFANYGDRFDLEKQLMAASGYVVFYCNPRGSTSYGAEFANLIHHAYPGDDFYDLDSGVDAVIAKGYVDPTAIYVTGGSGGGVLTCWTIGHTTRFRAAVTVYPVINWYSMILTSDIGSFVVKRWFPGFPWDHPDHYEKRSLLSVVRNVKTPTMVLTGEADYRTPISDSEQYYQALKLLGIETVLVRVPDEPHGIAARPSHHISKVLHIIGWFDRHTPGSEKTAQ